MARKSDGWVKIHYGILKEDLTPSQFKFFVGSILLANPPTAKDPGLVDLSARQLAKELRMSHVEVWRKEQELAKQDMITILSKGFQINKYAYYQGGASVTHMKQQSPLQSVSPTKQIVTNMKQTVTNTKRSVTNLVPKQTPKKEEVLRSTKKIPPKKKQYLFNNILLTGEEYQKLVARFGEAGTKDRLEALSLYKKSKGKKYKDDYATVLAWERREERQRGGQGGTHRQSPRQLPKKYHKPEDF